MKLVQTRLDSWPILDLCEIAGGSWVLTLWRKRGEPGACQISVRRQNVSLTRVRGWRGPGARPAGESGRMDARAPHISLGSPLLLTNHRIPVCEHVLVTAVDQKPVHLLQLWCLFHKHSCPCSSQAWLQPTFFGRTVILGQAGLAMWLLMTIQWWLHIHCHLRNFQKSKSWRMLVTSVVTDHLHLKSSSFYGSYTGRQKSELHNLEIKRETFWLPKIPMGGILCCNCSSNFHKSSSWFDNI